MITFKQYLEEKAMNAKAFAQTELRLATIAKVGFEFECFVPAGSAMHAGEDQNRDSMQIRQIDSLDEIQEYFNVTANEMRGLQRDYDNWVDERRDEWIESNLDQDLVDSEGEKYAAGRAEEEFDANHSEEISFDEFVDREFGSMYLYISGNDLEPRFGWAWETQNDSSSVYTEESASDGDGVQTETFKNIENDLSNTLGANVTTEFKGAKAHYEAGDWIVVPDSSIAGENGVGVEINSPPETLEKALKSLYTMFSWMKAHDIETNISTGLHINVSLPNIKDVDLVKLVLFLGEKHALAKFGRLGNTYTVPQLQRIANKLLDTGKLPTEADAMVKIARDAMSTSKYSSVNIEKLKDNYLEFRIAGGADYHTEYNKIRETVLRFVSALEIAVDPKAEREQYMKKLSKLLGAIEDSGGAEFQTKSIEEIMSKNMDDATKQNLDSWLTNVKAGMVDGPSSKERRDDWVSHYFIPSLGSALKGLGISQLTSKQIAELKLILKKLEVGTSDLWPGRGSDASWLLKQLGFPK